MLVWNLFKAEILKAHKMSINQILMIIMSIMGAFFYIAMVGMAKIYGGGYLREAEIMLALPRSLELCVMEIGSLGIVISIIYMANSIGSEYGRDTWKMILPRYGSRVSFLGTKLATAFLAMIVLFAFTIGFWAVCSLLGTVILQITTVNEVLAGERGTVYSLKILAITALKMSFYGLLTVLATIIARSVVGGIVAGMALSLTLASATSVPVQSFVRAMPSIHINNLEMHWTKNTKGLEELSYAFGTTISPETSLCVVFGSILLIIGLAFYLFSKRDMAGL
ncbi:MAG: hypothetical protein HY819_09705 [Acidobacteria bacterium]|nr:hypothetical protein [Acidobacteriota bacterium]